MENIFLQEEKIEFIIERLKYPENLFLERTNVFLFYRNWKDGLIDDINSSILNIQKSLQSFIKGEKDNNHYKVIDKFKKDIQDMLIFECGEKIIYPGIQSFIKMSAGIPRILLVILKHIYKWSYFNGENPFNGGIISLDAQQKGLKDAVEWFFEDARSVSNFSKDIRDGISRLGTFLKEIRYSNTPPECSLCAVSIDISEISIETYEYINLATQYSYLLKKSDRKDKNSKRKDVIFQINGILAPKWDLPLYKRGELKLTNLEVDAIFNPSQTKYYKQVLKDRLNRYNAPFRNNDLSNNQTTLFKIKWNSIIHFSIKRSILI